MKEKKEKLCIIFDFFFFFYVSPLISGENEGKERGKKHERKVGFHQIINYLPISVFHSKKHVKNNFVLNSK